MTYRDDLDALTARHAALQVDVAKKQRELAEVGALLAEARRVDQAETHFARQPALRRRQRRHLIAGALIALVAGGAALGATSAQSDAGVCHMSLHTNEWTAAVTRARIAAAEAERRIAVREALDRILASSREAAAARRAARARTAEIERYVYPGVLPDRAPVRVARAP